MNLGPPISSGKKDFFRDLCLIFRRQCSLLTGYASMPISDLLQSSFGARRMGSPSVSSARGGNKNVDSMWPPIQERNTHTHTHENAPERAHESYISLCQIIPQAPRECSRKFPQCSRNFQCSRTCTLSALVGFHLVCFHLFCASAI